MRPLTKLIPPTDPAATEDAFAEFASESAVPVDARDERDWFSEFPEEKAAQPAPARAVRPANSQQRSTSWLTLSESLKDEKA